MRKQIMEHAWHIAKMAQIRFGGNVKDFFAESLKLAWTYYKNSQAVQAAKLAYENQYRAYPVGAELPQLNGSEKQINWAKNIREEILFNMKTFIESTKYNRKLTDAQAEKFANDVNALLRWAIENKTEARYWIYIKTEIGTFTDSALKVLSHIRHEMVQAA